MKIWLIKIDSDVFPVPPIKILPIQIVLIINFFLLDNFLKKLIKYVIMVKGKNIYVNRFFLSQKSGFFKFIKNMFV